MGAGPALGPGDRPVLEHERRPGGVDGLDRRVDDRLERLLEVERLRDRLGDGRERLQLGDAALRVVVELRVLDRLGHLAGDRHEQVDLVAAELARRLGADVERALEPVAGEDRDGEDRLVVRLAQVREVLEARIEMRLARIITGARSAAAVPVIPSPGRILGTRVMSSTRVPYDARRTSSSAASS